VVGVLALVLLAGRTTNAQRARGELRIEVRDPQGAVVPTEAELVSDANQFRRTFQVGLDGRYVVQDLAFGVYRLSVRRGLRHGPAWSKFARRSRFASR